MSRSTACKRRTEAAEGRNQVAAVLDLNGDGKMEIVIESGYYEGGATLVIEIQDGKPVMVYPKADSGENLVYPIPGSN